MREPLTLDQAMRAYKPPEFTPEEWAKLHRASRGERPGEAWPTCAAPGCVRPATNWVCPAGEAGACYCDVHRPPYRIVRDPDTPFTGTLPPPTHHTENTKP